MRKKPTTTQNINKKIKKAFILVVIKIVNITCHIKIISKENKIPIYHRLLRLRILQASHLQKKPWPLCLNILFT